MKFLAAVKARPPWNPLHVVSMAVKLWAGCSCEPSPIQLRSREPQPKAVACTAPCNATARPHRSDHPTSPICFQPEPNTKTHSTQLYALPTLPLFLLPSQLPESWAVNQSPLSSMSMGSWCFLADCLLFP